MLDAAMALVILFYYQIKVIPGAFHAFFQITGGGDSLYSKLLAIRRGIWIRGEDRFEQRVGFRFDEYMNTAYVNLLFMLNMFIMINTDDAFEILLNALAFEFIVSFDEEFVDSPWWDPKRRWIMAGAMELVLQDVLLRRALANATLFAEEFDVSVEAIKEACDGDPHVLRNPHVASRDQNDTDFMHNDEVVKHLCRQVALDMKNKEAIIEYEKPRIYFGRLMKHYKYLLGHRTGGGIFDRTSAYRTWSRWEKVLFLAKVPDLDETLYTDPVTGQVKIVKELEEITSTPDKPFANLTRDSTIVGNIEWDVFLNYYLKVLSFRMMAQMLWRALEERKFALFVFRFFDGILQWSAFVLQVVFPVYAFIAIYAMLRGVIVH
mmetsp:Transcript_12718/g.29561  ORF Transcript_12718/g.29561 Transcript_12718/m.29561 type:complete len:377 (+) Transcript_12718:402-1532(+)